MNDKTNSYIGNFIVKNFKTIAACVIFVCGLYIQYQASMMRIEQLEKEVAQVKAQVDAQYAKLDNMKLDKAVFEATMKQFTEMSTDIRQIRSRLEDVLGEQEYHKQTKQYAEKWR
jgi:paraquat-inducible protein B